MKLVICNECQSAFTPTEKIQTCTCGKSSGRTVDGITHYSGESARAINIYDVNILSDIELNDTTAIIVRSAKQEKLQQDREFVCKVLEYLNSRAGTDYKLIYPSSNGTLIINRRDEHKCTLQEFFRIIDNKTRAWLGQSMEIYLRPKTLFNKTNFSNYIGEKNVQQQSTKTFDKLTDTANQAKRDILNRSNQGQQ